MSKDEPFAARWLRRKTAAASHAGRSPASTKTPEQTPSEGTRSGPPSDLQCPGAGEPRGAQTNPEGDFADLDFEALCANSDYPRFLAPGVPDAVKTKALARLWRSHPAFAQVDPLQDYAGDFTDKALASPDDLLQTAYRIGRGFITEEVDRPRSPAREGASSHPLHGAFLRARTEHLSETAW